MPDGAAGRREFVSPDLDRIWETMDNDVTVTSASPADPAPTSADTSADSVPTRRGRHARVDDAPGPAQMPAADAPVDSVAELLRRWREDNARRAPSAPSESDPPVTRTGGRHRLPDSAAPAAVPAPAEVPTSHPHTSPPPAAPPPTTQPPPTSAPPAPPEPVQQPTASAFTQPAADQPAGDRSAADRSLTAATPAIEVNGLHKRFKDMVAVHDVSFSVPKGSIVALLGPNGAGKTTTVNMLCTLLRPDGGHARVAGHDVATEPAAVRRSIMLTGQFAALDEALTGRENLILFGRLLGLRKSAAVSRADELLEQFSLVDAGGKRVGQYSGGMRRRIDIACGLVTSPDVVFLDEPTTGLDPRSRQEVWALVERLRESGVTTLLTTQYLEEADVLSDNIVVIDHGRVIAQGTSDELKSQTGASHCVVTPELVADLPQLTSMLADLQPHESDDGLSVSVPAPRGAETLVEVVRRTTAADVRLADVAMRRPSLDEVFLHLTDPERS